MNSSEKDGIVIGYNCFFKELNVFFAVTMLYALHLYLELEHRFRKRNFTETPYVFKTTVACLFYSSYFYPLGYLQSVLILLVE